MGDLGLPSVFRVGEFAAGAVTAAHTQAAAFLAVRNAPESVPEVRVGVREAAIAFRSERYLRVDGEPAFEWAPLSGDYQTADGWIRLHCNFEHHAEIACRVLGVAQERTAVEAAVRERGRFELEDAIAEAGGVAAAMRTREEWLAHPQSEAVGAMPTVAFAGLGGGEWFAASSGSGGAGAAAGQSVEANRSADHVPGAAAVVQPVEAHRVPAATAAARPEPPLATRLAASNRPLSGIRVLDLTRIIAGPVAARTLAAYGADVTMVRAPRLPTISGLDLDFGFGKALRLLDLRSPEGRTAFLELVRAADVVVQSYRPGSLEALGLGPADLAEVNPRLVHVSVSAYGTEGPWGARRGFDSLVQMATGIAHAGMVAADAAKPVPLPAQVLDHAAGWYAAAGAVEALNRGGGLRVAVSLAGMAHALEALGRLDPSVGLAVPDPSLSDVEDLTLQVESLAGRLTHIRFPGTIDGAKLGWSGPPPTV